MTPKSPATIKVSNLDFAPPMSSLPTAPAAIGGGQVKSLAPKIKVQNLDKDNKNISDGSPPNKKRILDVTNNNNSSSSAPHIVESASNSNDNEDPANKLETAAVISTSESTGGSSDDRTSKDYYFDSYSHHAIHEEMLKDEVRTRTYEMAIMQNKHVFKDKIVLDVGCGTGILSMFAAQAGAKHVYGVDCSSIADQARQIVNLNGFSDTVTIIKGKIEEIELPVAEVDVIVSEWMGYFLLYESMLDTVLYARDKWLVKKNGIIFPDKAVMYLAAIEDGNVKRDRIDFWSNVYGFNMSPLKEIALKEPVVDIVDAKAVVTDAVPILRLDLATCTKEDAEFTASFQLKAERNDYVHGLVAYFECAFTQIHKPIGFSTAPSCRYTHWKQTIFYLEDSLVICRGENLNGTITCKPNKKNRRDLDIGVSLAFDGQHSNFEKNIEYRLR